MSFGETLVLNVGGADRTLVRINQEGYTGNYHFRNVDFELRVNIRHTVTNGKGQPKKDRHNFEVVQKIFAVGDDPEETKKTYFVMEAIPNDLSIDLTSAVASWAAASSGANLVKLLNWES